MTRDEIIQIAIVRISDWESKTDQELLDEIEILSGFKRITIDDFFNSVISSGANPIEIGVLSQWRMIDRLDTALGQGNIQGIRSIQVLVPGAYLALSGTDISTNTIDAIETAISTDLIRFVDLVSIEHGSLEVGDVNLSDISTALGAI